MLAAALSLIACSCIGSRLEVLRPVEALHAGFTQDGAALLIRSALGPTEQLRLYADLCRAAQGSYEWERLASSEHQPPDRPWPLCVWQHPFTDETNANAEPVPVLEWAHALAQQTARHIRTAPPERLSPEETARLAEQLDSVNYDSLVSLLYRHGGSLKQHVDKNLDGLGVAVSLGATCTFEFGGEHADLHSGDALFAPFGHVPHQVLSTHSPLTAPEWWQGLLHQPDRSDEGAFSAVTSFGRVRCSLQLRDASKRRKLLGHVLNAGTLRAEAAALATSKCTLYEREHLNSGK